MQPRAGAERVIGLVAEAGGGMALKVAVSAPPEGGRANAAVMALLAELFRVPRGSLAVVLGAADRRKVVAIAGDPATVAARITEGLRPWSIPAS